jgi:hypothetical protein
LYKAEHGYCSDLLQQQQEPLRNYLFDNHALEALNEINTNCSSVAAFNNRFFRWFDAFRVVKFLNYASREYYRQIPVSEAAVEFLKITGRGKMHRPVNPLDLLMLFRELERKGER